jgi:hypothetical protein
VTHPKHGDAVGPGNGEESFLQRQAWDYFNTHAAQRMTVFNFYIALSSVTATGYFATFKSDSNLASARWIIAFLLCLFAFIFWKLDQRVKFLIKNAEHALKHFEAGQPHAMQAKVFLREEAETTRHRELFKGWRKILFWRLPLSYSDCFNLVYLAFFLIGVVGLSLAASPHVHRLWWVIRKAI